MTRSAALRYALAPACIALAALLHLSPVGPFLHPTGLFVFAVIAAAWFGGAGPGLLAAVLATFALPQLIPMSYPLLAGVFDLPRFITFALTGLAVGWGATRRRRAEAALREVRNELEAKVTERTRAVQASEERYAFAMQASGEGHWDWKIATDEFYASPRWRVISGFAPDEKLGTRAQMLARYPFHPEDRPKYEAAVAAHFAGATPRVDMEVRITPHGTLRWVKFTGMCLRDAAGAPLRWAGSIMDITEQKRAQEALRESEQRYERAMEATEAGHWEWDLVKHQVFHSPRFRELYGVSPEETFTDREAWKARQPVSRAERERQEQALQAAIADPTKSYDLELSFEVRPGEIRWLRSRGKVFRAEDGRPLRVTGATTDITARKLAEEALRVSEERYSLAIEASEEGFVDANMDTDEFFTSDRLNEIFGIAPGTHFKDRSDFLKQIRFYGNDGEIYEREIRAVAAQGGPERYEFEFRILLPSGEMRWLRTRGKARRDAAGRARRRIGVVADITARKRAEQALRESEQRYERAMEGSDAGHWDWNIVSDEMFVSERAREMLALPAGALPARRSEIMALVPQHPDDRAGMEETVAAGIATGTYERDYRVIPRAGEVRWLRARAKVFKDARGAALRMTGSLTDITERKLAADELRESEVRFRSLTELSSDWYWEQDEDLRFTYLSNQAFDLTGYSAESSLGKRRWEIANMTPLSSSWTEHQAVLAARQPFRDFETCRVGPDGTVRHLSLSGAPIFDEHGRFKGYQGIGRNITERRQAEEEFKRLERQLRQAQRLEAMGTLAGGIAHDFNNILGAILGYGEMALRDAAKGSRLRRDLDSILVAGERGRALVDRILAFSRSGVGERVAVHVEKVVREALDLLSAKLPPNVTLHAKLHAGPAAMLGDATQVHQLLMNLATNAIQAMPSGGTLRVSLDALRVEAARAPTIGSLAAADYLVLQVADTGTGIAPEIVDKIFDPFFTTKEVGTGTGLGLSLVHGIVTELGGAIDVASTVGAGSTFTVYLPRSGDALASFEKQEPELPRGDGQRVLVVDDEEPLVRLATRTLEELGYAPTGFTSSVAALAAFRADPHRFDALITDERMPGMSGSVLIREVRGIRNRMPIVLMSGFVGGAVAIRAREAGAEEVLKKPLSARDLAASLARVLHP